MSVIVPFHNVEPYLAECIESITSQAGPTLELLLVDDGSTDASPKIAAHHAARDSRIILLATPSLGPGGARNAGIRRATGDYLAFVDSDDRLAKDALKTLVHAMEADQVDVVVAAVARFNSTRRWNPRWVGELHDRPRHRITVEDFPDVIRNNYSWNKLYRRDYWLRQDLWFEDRVTFQDQPLVAQMLWRAGSITVLDAVVYEYRDRDDRSSISQRTEEFTNLRDRVAAWDRTVAAIDRDKVSGAVASAWFRTLLQTHFHWYLRTDSIADPAYWRMLRESYLSLRRRFSSVSLDSIHARQRLPLALLEQDDPSTLHQLLHQGGAASLSSESAPEGSRLIPGDTLRAVPSDMLFTPLPVLFMEGIVVRAGWSGRDGELVAELDFGFACADHFDAPDRVELELRDLNGAVACGTDVCSWLTGDAVGPAFGLQHLARSRITLPATLPSGSYQLWLTLVAGERRKQVPAIRLLSAGGAPEAGSGALAGSRLEARLRPGPHSHAPVRIVVDQPAISARTVAVTAEGVTLEVAAVNTLSGVEFRSDDGQLVVVPPHEESNGVAVVATALPQLTAVGSWSILAIDDQGRKRGIRWVEGAGAAGWPRGGDAIVARATARGNLKLDAFPTGVALATSLSADGVMTTTLPTEGDAPPAEHRLSLAELSVPTEPLVIPARGTVVAAVPVVATQRLLDQLPVVTDGGLTVTRARPRRLAVR